MTDVTADNSTEVAQTGRYKLIFNAEATEYIRQSQSIPVSAQRAPAIPGTIGMVVDEMVDAALSSRNEAWQDSDARFSLETPKYTLRESLVTCHVNFNPAAMRLLNERASKSGIDIPALLAGLINRSQNESATGVEWSEKCKVSVVPAELKPNK